MAPVVGLTETEGEETPVARMMAREGPWAEAGAAANGSMPMTVNDPCSQPGIQL